MVLMRNVFKTRNYPLRWTPNIHNYVICVLLSILTEGGGGIMSLSPDARWVVLFTKVPWWRCGWKTRHKWVRIILSYNNYFLQTMCVRFLNTFLVGIVDNWVCRYYISLKSTWSPSWDETGPRRPRKWRNWNRTNLLWKAELMTLKNTQVHQTIS